MSEPLLASDLFAALGPLVTRPGELTRATVDGGPALVLEDTPEKVTVAWAQGSPQVQWTLELTFPRAPRGEITWGARCVALKSRLSSLVESPRADGSSVRCTGNRLTLHCWHDNHPARGVRLAKRCEWFEGLASLVAQKPRITGLIVGWGAAFGPVRHVGFDLDHTKAERFLTEQGYRLTWPDGTALTKAELERHPVQLPRGVGWRRAPNVTATECSLDWGYRGPKFQTWSMLGPAPPLS